MYVYIYIYIYIYTWVRWAAWPACIDATQDRSHIISVRMFNGAFVLELYRG